MNFALLGNDPSAKVLIEAALSSGHTIAGVACASQPDHGTASANVKWFESFTVRSCSWEQWLTDNSVEAVIVAGESDEIQNAAKQLASAGKPLLIVPQLSFGTACAYELSLIRDDARGVLMPAFVHRGDADLLALSQRLKSNALGAVRRMQIEVELPTRVLTDAEIEAAALPDIDVLRWLGGNYDQVTSQRSGQTEQGCSQATLTLAGTGLPDATLIVRCGDVSSWRLTVETERDAETVSLASQPALPNALRLWQAFVSACGGETAQPDWPDAVRVFDVLDAARRSLRRRRTIDLHFETLSERQQFKTQMTAIGCGLLLLTLTLMLGLLGLGSLLESRDRSIKEAITSGLMLADTDFIRGSVELTAESQTRLDQMTQKLKDELKSAYIQPTTAPPSSDLDQRRRAALATRLAERGVVAANHRTLLAPAQGTAWDILLRILRLAWLAPLMLFLLLQLLLFVAKPASNM